MYREAEVLAPRPFFRELRPQADRRRPRSRCPASWCSPPAPGARPPSSTAPRHLPRLPAGAGRRPGGRDGHVWVRSLGRLEPRRRDPAPRRRLFCDPLELQPDSHLGVPGLLEACASGTWWWSTRSAAASSRTRRCCATCRPSAQHFLGRELQLDSVRTWWCGDPEDRAHVLDHLDALVVKPVFRAPGNHSVGVARARRAAAPAAAGCPGPLGPALRRPGTADPSRLPVFGGDGHGAAPGPAAHLRRGRRRPPTG